MNEKDIKRLYKAHAAETAPDMDALWNRIESGLEEKDALWSRIESSLEEKGEMRVISAPEKKRPRLGRYSLIGAAAAVIIILPIAAGTVLGNGAKNMTASDSSAANNGVYFAAPEAVQDSNGAMFSEENGYLGDTAAAAAPSEEANSDGAYSAGAYSAENDWTINIFADKTVLDEGEPLHAYAELEYVGSGDEATVSGSVWCMRFSLVGDRYFADGQGGEVVPDILAEHTIKKGEPFRREYTALAAFSESDPDADFYRKFCLSDEVILPKGNYTLTVYTDIQTESGERINKSASLDITVN